MYGSMAQYAVTYKAELVDAYSTLYVYKLCCTFHYYAIAVDQTMMVALNTIAASQAHHDHRRRHCYVVKLRDNTR